MVFRQHFRTHVSEGLRIFRHSLDRRFRGHKRYKGSSAQICRSIVDGCWNSRFHFFQTSTGHYCQFYSRDFGLCTDALIQLGYGDKVRKTLEYALQRYSGHKKITVAITPNGRPFDFPYYGIDSVAFLVRSLRAAKAFGLVKKYRVFLETEAKSLFSIAIDADTGLVRKDRVFSSMKDYARRSSSCYDNVMVAMLKAELDRLKLENPLRHYNYKKIIMDAFWNGSYFADDLSSNGDDYVAGDANVFPFWSGLFSSAAMLGKSINAIRDAGLDSPFPLKYASRGVRQGMIAYEILVRGWQADAIWTQLGPGYISLLKRIDREEAGMHIAAYSRLIEQHGTYFEVFSSSGKPFSTAFYHADEGMLWASLYLDLVTGA